MHTLDHCIFFDINASVAGENKSNKEIIKIVDTPLNIYFHMSSKSPSTIWHEYFTINACVLTQNFLSAYIIHTIDNKIYIICYISEI